MIQSRTFLFLLSFCMENSASYVYPKNMWMAYCEETISVDLIARWSVELETCRWSSVITLKFSNIRWQACRLYRHRMTPTNFCVQYPGRAKGAPPVVPIINRRFMYFFVVRWSIQRAAPEAVDDRRSVAVTIVLQARRKTTWKWLSIPGASSIVHSSHAWHSLRRTVLNTIEAREFPTTRFLWQCISNLSTRLGNYR